MEPQQEDSELRNLLREWQAPPVPPSLEKRLFRNRKSWWRASIRIPLPIACCLTLLMAALLWHSMEAAKPLPARLVIQTKRIEVPVARERVVTKIIYKNRSAARPQHQLTFNELRPVAELRLKIVRHQDAKN